MVFWMWEYGHAPLNSQWQLLENGGTDFHYFWYVEGGAIIIGCAHALPKRLIYSNRTVI